MECPRRKSFSHSGEKRSLTLRERDSLVSPHKLTFDEAPPHETQPYVYVWTEMVLKRNTIQCPVNNSQSIVYEML